MEGYEKFEASKWYCGVDLGLLPPRAATYPWADTGRRLSRLPLLPNIMFDNPLLFAFAHHLISQVLTFTTFNTLVFFQCFVPLQLSSLSFSSSSCSSSGRPSHIVKPREGAGQEPLWSLGGDPQEAGDPYGPYYLINVRWAQMDLPDHSPR